MVLDAGPRHIVVCGLLDPVSWVMLASVLVLYARGRSQGFSFGKWSLLTGLGSVVVKVVFLLVLDPTDYYATAYAIQLGHLSGVEGSGGDITRIAVAVCLVAAGLWLLRVKESGLSWQIFPRLVARLGR